MESVENIRDLRLSTLHTWQRFYNMQPREDSQLTQLYVDGKIHMPVEEIARELMATDFIYKETLYGQIIEDFMRKLASNVQEKYHISWTATWTIVKFYGPVALKLLMLLHCGVRIPERLSPTCDEKTASSRDEGDAAMASSDVTRNVSRWADMVENDD